MRYACTGCGNAIDSDDTLYNAWHPACWLEELRRRYSAANTDAEREALATLGKGAARYAGIGEKASAN
jgi:hypothetical protein